MSSSDYFFKLIMLGSSGAGKTSIVQRYCNDVFESLSYKTTLGFDFLSKKLTRDEKIIDLEVWDTAGQEQYKAVTKMYYKDVHGAILVYDTTDLESFEKVKFWLDDLEMYGNKMEKRILVGSKMDLKSRRAVTQYDAKKFASERQIEWAECSAKTGEGIAELFDFLIGKVIETYNSDEEFKKIYGRSTIVSIGPPISPADAAHRNQGYKLRKTVPKGKRKSSCC